MDNTLLEQDTLHFSLIDSRNKARALFEKVQAAQFITPGVFESELNDKIYRLAEQILGTTKYWHKRIVRVGKNTLCPYRANPEDLQVQENDILYFDFEPILSTIEADYGRTYVQGSNPKHLTILEDLESVWYACRAKFVETPNITGRELYQFMTSLASQKGYSLAEWHCGHLVGVFPHEERLADEKINYICLENDLPLSTPAHNGETRHWILEVHLIKPEDNFGGFIEDLLMPDILL